MKIKIALGLKIKNLRKKQGISQEKFSEMVDMNPRQIVRIENGESFPTAENLEKIAEVLKIQPQELFYNDCFASNEYLISEIKKSIDRLSNKELRMIYLIVKNL
ncbi:helix-turn-helix transcriptional regulator [bacterium]|nr:helix-turn-helix transcriptional regulator [bacterium]